jgi:hypothetical protein
MGTTLVTARSSHRILRYGQWTPRPRVEGVSWHDLLYVNSDLHSPCFSNDRLEDCWVHTHGNQISFRQRGYRRFIQYLSWVFLGAAPHEVRKDPAGYYGQPFVEHIGSVVYATVIGPTAATKLLQDYMTHREHFLSCVRNATLNPMDWDSFAGSEDNIVKDLMDSYDNWIRAFAVASETGIVYTQYKSVKSLP